jgi:hypothetical protein
MDMGREKRAPGSRFAVCIRNDGYPAALEVQRLYRTFPAGDAEQSLGMLRVQDESGEAYLYPRELFRAVQPPPASRATTLPDASGLRFVVRLGDDEDLDLTCDRLYPVLPDESAARSGRIRIVDDSGEDYLYPRTLFQPVDVPRALGEALLRASRGRT